MTWNRTFLTLTTAFLLACCPVAMTMAQDEEAAPAEDAAAMKKQELWNPTKLQPPPHPSIVMLLHALSVCQRPKMHGSYQAALRTIHGER